MTNFARTLPPAQSDLAQEALKDDYALRDMNKPIGASSYQLTKALPNAPEGRLPTTKELEEKLRRRA